MIINVAPAASKQLIFSQKKESENTLYELIFS